MATISGNEQGSLTGLNLTNSWQMFSEAQHRQMIREDIEAGVSVAIVLTGVLFAGVVIGFIGVMLSL